MKFDVLTIFEDFLAGQRENAMLWVAVFLGIGAASYFSLPAEPDFLKISGVFGGLVALFGMLFRRYAGRQESRSALTHVVLAGCLLAAGTGFMAAAIKTDLVRTPMLERETRPVMVEATLDHREDQDGKKGTLLFLSDVVIEHWDAAQTPSHIRLTTRKPTDARAGDRVSLLAKLTPLSPPVAPRSYDFARHYYFEGIGALGYSLSDIRILSRTEESHAYLESLRGAISARIYAVAPAREAGIVAALMTGERAAIADEDWDALRASGLAHIISISGLHVVMVAAPVFFVVRLLLAMIPYATLRWPIKKIAAAVALVVCCFYVGLVVPSVPTTRALLMTGVGLIAVMLDRSPFSLRIVAFSAILVLICSPESIWSVSFQMSFAAVTSLVAMAEWARPYVAKFYQDAGWIKRAGLFVAGTLLTSLVASVATAAYSLYHFQQLASYSVLANALSVPISGIMIMPMVILTFFLMPFGAADWSIKIMATGVHWLLEIAEWTQSLRGAVLTTPALPHSFMILMTIAGLVLLLMRGRGKFLSLFPIMAAIGVLFLSSPPDILVTEDGQVMAVRAGEQVYVSSLRKDKFAVETWLKRWNKKDVAVIAFPKQGTIDANPELSGGFKLRCDPAACRIDLKGRHIVFGNRPYELKQDCDWADVIITEARLPGRNFCGNKDVQIIDYYGFKRGGALSMTMTEWQGDHDMILYQTNPDRGQWPWVRGYQPSRTYLKRSETKP